MANPELSALTLLIEEEIANVNFRPYVMLSRLMKRDAFQSKIQWDANVGGGAASGRATTEDATTVATDLVKKAELAIGDRVLNHAFSIKRNDIVQAKRTAPGALRDLFASHVRTGFEVIFPALNKVLYTGTGNAASHGVLGMAHIIDNTQNYAGINATTYTDWQCYVNANAGVNRALSRTLFSAVDVAVSRRGVAYDAIVTTPELIEVYGALFSTDRALNTTQVNGTADIGFSGYTYKGKPIIADTDCPNNTLYFLDSSQLCLYTYALTDSISAEQAVMANVEKTEGMNFLVAQLPSNNPHAIKFEISLQPQLKLHNRKCVAVLKDITQ